jgi:hypothetical protein
LVLGKQKNYGKNLGQSGTFNVLIGRFQLIPAILCFCKIQKTFGIFSILGQICATFFFSKYDFEQTIGPRIIKNRFFDIF